MGYSVSVRRRFWLFFSLYLGPKEITHFTTATVFQVTTFPNKTNKKKTNLNNFASLGTNIVPYFFELFFQEQVRFINGAVF